MHQQRPQHFSYLLGTTPDCRRVQICDRNADCIFSPGSNSMVCSCRRGYLGDGIRCIQEPDGGDVGKFMKLIEAYCRENQSSFSVSIIVLEITPDCRRINICDPNADCIFNPRSNSSGCSCKWGFTGDGRRCTQLPEEENRGNQFRLSHLRFSGIQKCKM